MGSRSRGLAQPRPPAVLIRADVDGSDAVSVPVERHSATGEVTPVAHVDAAVDRRASPAEAQVARWGYKARVCDETSMTAPELDLPPVEEVVVLVERRVGVADFPDRLDNVVAQGEDVGAAAGVAHEALAGTAAQVDRVVVGARVQDRAEAAGAAAGDQEGRAGERGADEVVGEGVVGRARVAELAEVVVVDRDVVVDVVALAAEDLDRGAVAAVVVGEGVRA